VPEIRKHLLNHCQECGGGYVDDEGEGIMVVEMRQDVLNCGQMGDDGTRMWRWLRWDIRNGERP
jgi:hypothetical protein